MQAEILEMLIPMTLEGLGVTLGVFAITLVASLPLSVPLAILRLSKNKFVSGLVGIYITIMRGTPLLLQLMFIFFGFHFVPVIGYAFSRYQAVAIAFILNYAAYFAEILRGGINAVDPGQFEASYVLGFSKSHTYRRIILPQVLRNVMPSISNEVITLVKDTSLVYILGVSDILKAAKSVSNTYSSFLPYVFTGLVYLVLIAVLTKVLNYIEKKVNYFR